MSMDKNIIKSYLHNTFISEVASPTPATTPAIKLAKKIGKENGKENKDGVSAIGKDMKDYEKSLTKSDPNEKEMAPNKYNYDGNTEKDYHDQMEIMNGQEMIQYDRTNDRFKERAIEAIEGSSKMGNNPEWANVVQPGWGGDPEFGKNLVKKIKASEKKRVQQTPTSKMFGDDWEVVKDEGHRKIAVESVEDKTKCPICDKSKSDCKCTDKEKGAHAMKGLDADYEKYSRAQQHGINPEVDENTNKNKSQIKESMKRLKFNKEFNGVGNALKLIPESYKVDNKVFEMTDGNEHYRIRWEGSVNEGSAVILMASDKKLVNEDMQKMKHLMGYKSEETIGLLKGKERIQENSAFSDIWNKTKKLMTEVEENEGDDSEHSEWEEAIPGQAPEAKKHVDGSVGSDKKTQASSKTGAWEEATPSQAPEAKKHVQGSVGSDKKTQTSAKTGDLDDAVGHAPEAKKHVKMAESVKKKITEIFEDETDELSSRLDAIKSREEDDDAPVIKRKDAYDASLDIPDPEDLEKNLSTADIEKQAEPVKFAGADVEDDDDDIDIPQEMPSGDIKLMRSASTGKYAIVVKQGSQIMSATDVPEEYMEMAAANPAKALQRIKADKEAEMSDEEIMEVLSEMLSEAKMSEAEIEKGKFTEWCKKNGFENGASISCAKKAMSSDSKSAHKMATFYMNTVKPKGKTTKDI